jgi:hypothetical protein
MQSQARKQPPFVSSSDSDPGVKPTTTGAKECRRSLGD